MQAGPHFSSDTVFHIKVTVVVSVGTRSRTHTHTNKGGRRTIKLALITLQYGLHLPESFVRPLSVHETALWREKKHLNT